MRWKIGFKSKKLEVSPSATSALATLSSALEPFRDSQNKYQVYQSFLRSDPELNNAITRLALLTAYAYKGPYVKAGTKLTESEKLLQDQAIEAADELDFRSRFFSLAKHLLRDGDAVYVVAFEDDVGVQQIQPLPLTKTTIVESEDQLEKADAKVQKRGLWILNELEPDKRQIFPQNENQKVFHFSVDDEAEEVYDILNRWTFGVWSDSPLECLKTTLLWKQALRIADILWRYRNVPREVHELDTSMFVPEKFAGATWEEQVTNATKAAEDYLKDYAKKISGKKVDQGYVVGSNVKQIYYVEPKQVSYASPNDLIDQINTSIREGIGAYTIGKGTYATELVISSYVILMPDHLAYKIERQLLELLRFHLAKKYKTPADELAKLDLRLSLVLDILKGELVRQMAILAATGTLTIDELREYVGKDQLTDEQIARLIQIKGKGRTGQFAQTLLDVLALTERQTAPEEPVTPQSARERAKT
jgi:hypothetical protein